MNKYLTLVLLPSMLLLSSCGLVDEYLDSSETPENSREIEEPVPSNNEDTDELEAKDNESHSAEENHKNEMEEEMRLEKEEEMRLEMEEGMILEKSNANSFIESVNVVDGPSFEYFDRYADIETLRIFALPEVSDEYLRKVGAIYKLMFDENPDIDKNLQNEFFQTMKNLSLIHI